MSKTKYDQLRDEVILRARNVADSDGSYADVVELQNAFDIWNGHLAELADTPGAWVHGSPGTSQAAAIKLTPRSGSVRREVLNELAIGQYGGFLDGLTCDELETRLRRPHTTVSSAVNWLMNGGWVVDSGLVRTTRGGCDAVVWILTGAAIERLRGST